MHKMWITFVDKVVCQTLYLAKRHYDGVKKIAGFFVSKPTIRKQGLYI
jgi:hypothetical protein